MSDESRPGSPLEWQARWARLLQTYGSRAAGLTQEAAKNLADTEQQLARAGADFIEWQARWSKLMADFVEWQARWTKLVAEFEEWQGRWREIQSGFATSQANWSELGKDFFDELRSLQRDALAFPMEWQRQARRWLAPLVGGSPADETRD